MRSELVALPASELWRPSAAAVDAGAHAALLSLYAAGVSFLRAVPGWLAWAGMAAAILLPLLLLLLTARRWRFYMWMRVLAWALFFYGPLWLATGAWLLWPQTPGVGAALLCALGASVAVVAVDAFVIEPRWLRLRRYVLSSPKLHVPCRVAVLADLQVDRVGGHERAAVRMALAQRPDVILLPGDHVQEHTAEGRARLRAELRQLFVSEGLAAPLGVFACDGNVDVDATWAEAFRGLGATTFGEERSVRLRPDLALTGLSVASSGAPQHRVDGVPGFHVVMGHKPDFALGRVDADLLVAGHTHGGQVRLPGLGPLLTFAAVPRRWAAGLTRLPALSDSGRSTDSPRSLVVSRGVGLERGLAPRVRFLCRPEVVLIELLPAPAGGATAPEGTPTASLPE